MPMITTMAGMSARGFGMFGYIRPLPVGDLGMFPRAGTGGTKPINLYSYTAHTVTVSSNITTTASNSCCAGVPSVAVVATGGSGSTTWNRTQKYNWSSAGVTAGSNLSGRMSSGGSANNDVQAVFALGGNVLTTNIYTFGNDAVAGGTNLTANATYPAATGNATLGLISISSGGSTDRRNNKYTYATGGVVPGTLFATGGQSQGCAAGNADVAVFVDSGVVTDRYVYAGDTVATGASLTITTAAFGGAAGTSEFGIFTGNALPASSRYDYSNSASAAASMLSASGAAFKATSNGVSGVSAP